MSLRLGETFRFVRKVGRWRPDLNRRMRVLQTLALPLGYATEDPRFTCKPVASQRLPPDRYAPTRAVEAVENALASTLTSIPSFQRATSPRIGPACCRRSDRINPARH